MSDVSVVLYVRHPVPWLVEMTKAWIGIARMNTDIAFQLVVVEGGSGSLSPKLGYPFPPIEKYLNYPEGLGIAKEINKGLDICTGEYRVMVGNDVFVKPGWLEMLLEPFSRFPDCAASTLANSDGGRTQQDIIAEGLWGPLMMFGPEWRVDEDYEYCFIDADLCMRMYGAGFRTYRNYNQVVFHGNQMTALEYLGKQGMDDYLARDKMRFIEKHGPVNSHLWVYHAIVNGWSF